MSSVKISLHDDFVKMQQPEYSSPQARVQEGRMKKSSQSVMPMIFALNIEDNHGPPRAVVVVVVGAAFFDRVLTLGRLKCR